MAAEEKNQMGFLRQQKLFSGKSGPRSRRRWTAAEELVLKMAISFRDQGGNLARLNWVVSVVLKVAVRSDRRCGCLASRYSPDLPARLASLPRR
jgi:hypothetical protein